MKEVFPGTQCCDYCALEIFPAHGIEVTVQMQCIKLTIHKFAWRHHKLQSIHERLVTVLPQA